MRVISQLIYYRKTYQSVKRDLCDRNSLIIECVLRLALARDRERKGKWEGGGRSLARGGESAISRSPDVQNGEDLKEVELLVLEVSGELDYSETSSTEQVVYPRKTLISSAPSPCTHKHL